MSRQSLHSCCPSMSIITWRREAIRGLYWGQQNGDVSTFNSLLCSQKQVLYGVLWMTSWEEPWMPFNQNNFSDSTSWNKPQRRWTLSILVRCTLSQALSFHLFWLILIPRNHYISCCCLLYNQASCFISPRRLRNNLPRKARIEKSPS